MAYAKKTTATKKATTTKKTSTTKKPVEPVTYVDVDEVEIDDAASVEPEIEKVPEKKKHDPNDGILCRSVTVGGLFMVGQNTKILYEWNGYGDVIEVEYRDLASAIHAHSPFVFRPTFIVDDQDVVEEFKDLYKFYNEKFTISELSEIIYMNEDEMESTVSTLPSGAKEQLINIVSTKISTGELDSIRKIKTLERILGVDFGLVANIQ